MDQKRGGGVNREEEESLGETVLKTKELRKKAAFLRSLHFLLILMSRA